jgi:hypothetical protein
VAAEVRLLLAAPRQLEEAEAAAEVRLPLAELQLVVEAVLPLALGLQLLDLVAPPPPLLQPGICLGLDELLLACGFEAYFLVAKVYN